MSTPPFSTRRARSWAEPVLATGLGLLTYTFAADPETGPKVLEVTVRGSYGRELWESARNMLAEQGTKAMVGFHTQVGLLSGITSPPPVADPGFVQRHLRRVGVVDDGVDILGVIGADSSGQGVLLAALVPRGWQLKPAFRERWRAITSHLASGRRTRFLVAKPNPPRPPAVPQLTPRERAVVALAVLGRSNKLIAYELGLSLSSVGTYLQRAQRRLGVSSRAALIREFVRAASQESADEP